MDWEERMNEKIVLALILVMALSTLSMTTVKSASAQSIPTPSGPTFTLKLIQASYDVTTTNPYSGTVTTTQVDNSTIQVTIKNQPFTYSYNGTTYSLYYDVQTKGHFENDWTDCYPLISRLASQPVYNTTTSQYSEPLAEFINNNPIQSNSEYTVLSISAATYPPNSELDFRVQAIVGHESQYFVADHIYPPNIGHYQTGIIFDLASGWSNIQTINLANGSVSTSTSPTPISTAAVPELSWLTIIPLLVGVLYIVIVLRHQKTTKMKQ